MNNTLTTHVLDVAHGVPAEGMRIDFSVREANGWRRIKTVHTDRDGRAPEPLLDSADMAAGFFELLFHVSDYFRSRGAQTGEAPYLTEVPVRFRITRPHEHYHVPLLVTPWSYTTYRGS